jgi:hypothetical protein
LGHSEAGGSSWNQGRRPNERERFISVWIALQIATFVLTLALMEGMTP